MIYLLIRKNLLTGESLVCYTNHMVYGNYVKYDVDFASIHTYRDELAKKYPKYQYYVKPIDLDTLV